MSEAESISSSGEYENSFVGDTQALGKDGGAGTYREYEPFPSGVEAGLSGVVLGYCAPCKLK